MNFTRGSIFEPTASHHSCSHFSSVELTCHLHDLSKVHSLNSLDSLYQTHLEKTLLLINSYFLPPLHLFPGSWTWLGTSTLTLSGLKWALSLLESLSTFFQWSHSPVTETTTLHHLHILYSTPIDLFSAVSCENRSHQKRTSSSNSWTSLHSYPYALPGSRTLCHSVSLLLYHPFSLFSWLQYLPSSKQNKQSKRSFIPMTPSTTVPGPWSRISQMTCLCYLSASPPPFAWTH